EAGALVEEDEAGALVELLAVSAEEASEAGPCANTPTVNRATAMAAAINFLNSCIICFSRLLHLSADQRDADAVSDRQRFRLGFRRKLIHSLLDVREPVIEIVVYEDHSVR